MFLEHLIRSLALGDLKAEEQDRVSQKTSNADACERLGVIKTPEEVGIGSHRLCNQVPSPGTKSEGENCRMQTPEIHCCKAHEKAS